MDDNNTIVEVNNEGEPITETTQISDDEIKIELNNSKPPKKEFFWKRMSKKAKIITIVCILTVILLAVALVCVYFFVIKKEKKPEVVQPDVILEKSNYVYENGVLSFLGEDSKKIGTYSCVDKDPQKCFVAKLTDENEFDLPVYVNKKGQPIERVSKVYIEKYVFVYDDSKINLYNIEEKKIEGSYLLIKTGDIDTEFVVAKNEDDKYGILSFENDLETIVDFDYDYLGIYNDNETFLAKDGNKYYLLSSDEKRITGYLPEHVRSFDNKYVAIKNEDDEYHLYDYSGALALDEAYDYIDFNSSYIFVITDGKMYVYDSNLTLLNTGIKIKSTNYQKRYIFDDKNNLTDTKKAYTITVNTNGIISIEESSTKTVKNINVYESVISANYEYVSYLEGQLYIYQDKEKTELLGTYKCNNQNKVDASSTEFNNCFIAKESSILNEGNGYIPIFNNSYVFINDAKDDGKNIVLVDLKTNTQKAKYQAIDTGLGNEGISFITNVSSLIYAKNTEGNFGVITFKDGNPTGVIAFKENGNGTSKLEMLDDNIIATRGTKNYLYSKTGVLLATSNFKMQEYQNGYLVVKDKDYLVYDMSNPESGPIISNHMDYIKLYNDFFVGIKDKKLNIYLYTDGKTGVIETDLDVKLTDYPKSYKINLYSDSNVISIMQNAEASIDYKFNKDWSVLNEDEE